MLTTSEGHRAWTCEDSCVMNVWSNNKDPHLSWSTGANFGQSLGSIDVASLIESNSAVRANFEVAVLPGSAAGSSTRPPA